MVERRQRDTKEELLQASIAGRSDVCQGILVQQPSLLEACDRLGRTPLILAAMNGHPE
ncbi:unnamed protein product, partial [Symbiodinium pilosum]